MSGTNGEPNDSGVRETLRATLSLWKFWLWGAVGTLGAWYAYTHPKTIDGWFYEVVFGVLAVGAIVLGLRRLVGSEPTRG